MTALLSPNPFPRTPIDRAALEAEVERLLALLDALDGDPDLEADADDEPDSDGEPALGWANPWQRPRAVDSEFADDEVMG